jgi:N-acetylmuramoyl-L-alanine amidase
MRPTRQAPHRLGAMLPLCGVLVTLLTGAAGLSSPAPVAATTRTFVVVIDAGHQAKADLRTEPVGPGSKTRKPRVEGGTRGIVTRRPESLDNLQIALRLRAALVARGVKVIMIRTTQNVDISNAQRAQIANADHADLFIRLHCDGSANHAVSGVLTLVPARNVWTTKILSASSRTGRDIQAAVLAATHTRNRGIAKRGDLTGFNWSKAPVALVEMGVMTNAAQDRALATAAYQTKIATGIASGVMAFLAGK